MRGFSVLYLMLQLTWEDFLINNRNIKGKINNINIKSTGLRKNWHLEICLVSTIAEVTIN